MKQIYVIKNQPQSMVRNVSRETLYSNETVKHDLKTSFLARFRLFFADFSKTLLVTEKILFKHVAFTNYVEAKNFI